MSAIGNKTYVRLCEMMDVGINVRLNAKANLDGLVTSMQESGWLDNHPAVIYKLETPIAAVDDKNNPVWDLDKNGDILLDKKSKPVQLIKRYGLIQAHRRFYAASILAIRNPKDIRFHEVPAIVYEKLSQSERNRMVVDHFNVDGLNALEQYHAVVQLLNSGLSEDACAKHIGKSRGWVQTRNLLSQLPKAVEDAFKTSITNPDKYNGPALLSHKTLTTLKTALDNGEAEFNKTWTEMVTNPDSTKQPTPMTYQKMVEMANRVAKENPPLAEVIRHLAGLEVDFKSNIETLNALYREHVAAKIAARVESDKKIAAEALK